MSGSEAMQSIINLIRSITGQANILTIPRVFVDLTGDLKAALFLAQCIYWSSRSSTPGVFYKTYQEWENELSLSRYEIDNCRKRVTRWIKTDLHQVNGKPVLHYTVDLPAIADDLMALCSGNCQTIDSQNDLRETNKTICEKPTKRFARNQQNDLRETSKTDALALNVLTEITTETTTETTAAVRAADSICESPLQPTKPALPDKVQKQIFALGWRGSLADVEQAWREDAERVRQWLWYAKRQGWNGALLRTVLRNPGEYPPELDPDSALARRRYITGELADFIEC
ncbi:MAG: hypothetical protein HPY45_09920 [Anaerolineae bacterium]|nr:hypothetical protein [Anaerolineae bacterium]